MAVKLETLAVAAADSRFTQLLSSRYAHVNKIRGERIAGARISAKQIANYIDHGAGAEIHESTVGLNADEETAFRRQPANYGLLPAKEVPGVRFTHDRMLIDEIRFNDTQRRARREIASWSRSTRLSAKGITNSGFEHGTVPRPGAPTGLQVTA